MDAIKAPKTLQEAIVYFSDPQRAFDYAVSLRWPNGEVTCPRCQKAKHSFIKTRRIWFCYVCKKQFTLKVGTIMEDSPISLDKWMTAFWMLANCKNGISSYELGKAIGVHQESAWFMLQRIREVMKGKKTGRKLGGGPGSEIEADETFVGGLSKNMHRSRRLRVQQQDIGGVFVGKTIVQGILDRDLREVRAKVVPNVKRETLQNEVLNNVRYGSSVYTDDAVGYDKLHYRFVHDVVNHAEAYVKGRVHTNGLENFWSLLKRTLRGTYVAVEPFHLDRYVDEQVFRFNNRKNKTDAGHKPSCREAPHLQRTHRQRPIAALVHDRGGGNASPLLVLVGAFRLTRGRHLPAPLSPADCSLRNFEKCYHAAFKVLQCFRAFDVFMLLHIVSVRPAMANSRGRRTLRRMLQEAGLGELLKPPSPVPETNPIPFWKRIPATVYLGLGALALLITLLEGYPWLSVQSGEKLDPRNPYSEMFDVVNGGYIPVTNLDALCTATFTANGATYSDMSTPYPNFADYLRHDERVTIPCFRSIAINLFSKGVTISPGALLSVRIEYAFYYINMRPLRRTQEFRFKSIVGRDGSHHWQRF